MKLSLGTKLNSVTNTDLHFKILVPALHFTPAFMCITVCMTLDLKYFIFFEFLNLLLFFFLLLTKLYFSKLYHAYMIKKVIAGLYNITQMHYFLLEIIAATTL